MVKMPTNWKKPTIACRLSFFLESYDLNSSMRLQTSTYTMHCVNRHVLFKIAMAIICIIMAKKTRQNSAHTSTLVSFWFEKFICDSRRKAVSYSRYATTMMQGRWHVQ